MNCQKCGASITQPARGRKRKFCSDACRHSSLKEKRVAHNRTKVRTLSCPTCSGSFNVGYKSKKRYCSRNCYPVKVRKPRRNLPCQECGEANTVYRGRLFCDQCIVARRLARRIHSAETAEATRRGARLARERRAPGLGPHQRLRLLKSWKIQGRTCFYCSQPADTIDHIVPLSRGGTNYEGNLIPACRKCNGTKKSRFITEWMTRDARTSA